MSVSIERQCVGISFYRLQVSLDYHNSPNVAGSLFPVACAHNTQIHSSVLQWLIRKAQAILQDLPQGLTNLLSYVFVTSTSKHLIAPFAQIQSSCLSNISCSPFLPSSLLSQR